MRVSDLFNKLRIVKDTKSFSGALSTKEVKVHDPDTGDVYEVKGVVFDPENDCYFITVLVEDTDND